MNRIVTVAIDNPASLTELFLALVFAGLWLARRRLPLPGQERLPGALARLAEHPLLSLLFVGALMIGLRLLLLPILPFSDIVGRDESSIFLQAETFLQGRLANPPHPAAPFLESVYVHQWPSYGSMFFPGRGLEMMLGLALFGQPGMGTVLLLGITAPAMVWALRGWLPPVWAFAGGILFIVRYGLFSILGNLLIGLVVTALAGALVLGSIPRIERSVRGGTPLRWLDAHALAGGTAILLITRPFEAVLFLLPVAVVMALRLISLLRTNRSGDAARLAAPSVLSVFLAALLLLSYNEANTGDPFKAPYTLNRETHAGFPAFLFQEAKQASATIPEPIASYYVNESKSFERYRTPTGYAQLLVSKAFRVWSFYLGPLWSLPFLAGLFWVVRQPLLIAIAGLSFAGFAMLQFSWPHYLIGLIALVLLVVIAGLMRLASADRSAWLVPAVSLGTLALAALPVMSLTMKWPRLNPIISPCCYFGAANARQPVEAHLAQIRGPHLVFVRYEPHDGRFTQFVFNGADIDGSPVIWVHDLGSDENRQLIAHYPDRKPWLVVGVTTPQLFDYFGAVPGLREPL